MKRFVCAVAVTCLLAVVGAAGPVKSIPVPPINPTCKQVSGYDKKENALVVAVDKAAHERACNIVNAGSETYEFGQYDSDYAYVFYFAGHNRPLDITLSKVYQKGQTVFVEVTVKTSDHAGTQASPFLFFKVKKSDLAGKNWNFSLVENRTK